MTEVTAMAAMAAMMVGADLGRQLQAAQAALTAVIAERDAAASALPATEAWRVDAENRAALFFNEVARLTAEVARLNAALKKVEDPPAMLPSLLRNEVAAAVDTERERITASLVDPTQRRELLDATFGSSREVFNAALAPLHAAQPALPAGAILMGTFALGDSGIAAPIPAEKAAGKQPAGLNAKNACVDAWLKGIKFITPGASTPDGRAVTDEDLPNVLAFVRALQTAFIGYVVNPYYGKGHARYLTHTAETPLFIVRLGTTHTSCVEVYYTAELIAALTDSEGHLSGESGLAKVFYAANDLYLPTKKVALAPAHPAAKSGGSARKSAAKSGGGARNSAAPPSAHELGAWVCDLGEWGNLAAPESPIAKPGENKEPRSGLPEHDNRAGGGDRRSHRRGDRRRGGGADGGAGAGAEDNVKKANYTPEFLAMLAKMGIHNL